MAQTATHRREEDCADERKNWTHGTFIWNELMTRDVEQAKRFYGDTIGWRFEAMKMPDGRNYWCAMESGKPIAGIFPSMRRNSTACLRAGCRISPLMTWIGGSLPPLRPAPG
jgi:Bleomycin resistance protein-like N-terminal